MLPRNIQRESEEYYVLACDYGLSDPLLESSATGKGECVQAGALSGAAPNGAVSDQDNVTAEKLAELKTKVHSIFGEVVLAMSSVPRYRTQSLADLAHLIIDPLVRDRIAVASPKRTRAKALCSRQVPLPCGQAFLLKWTPR